jgi:iron(III) transport system permease protein
MRMSAPAVDLRLRRAGFDSFRPWPWLALLLVALAVGTPLAFLLLGSFSTTSLPGDFTWQSLGLANYAAVWLDPDTYEVAGNTAIYVLGTMAFGVSLAVLLAFLVERTDLPGRLFLYAGIPMTLAMPGMLQAMAWVLLFSPRIGFLNLLARWLLGLDAMPFNIYSMGGMIFVEGLRLVPTAFLMLVPLLRAMDPALEEAASVSGARPAATLRRVTARLLLPGLAAAAIYLGMTALEVFEVPGVLGLPAGIHVFSTRIYAAVHAATGDPDYGRADALAILYVLLAILATALYARIIRRAERFAMVSGKGYRPRRVALGRWRWPAAIFAFLYLGLAILLPFLVLLYISFLPFLQAPSAAALRLFTLSNYRQLWNNELIGTALANTAVMVLVTATATVLVSLAIALIVVRSKFAARKLLDQLTFLPHAIPGIVLGLAFFWLFLVIDRIGLAVGGGVLAISIAFTVAFMAYGTRALSAALLQIHRDLEEAARTSGASSWRVTCRIFTPLILPAMAGLWIWAVLHAVRQAGAPLILADGPDNQVLAVLIWNLWSHGGIPVVGALGTLMIAALILVTLALRLLGFGRALGRGA